MVGESVVTIEDFDIEAGKVEEFARAVKDPNPIHRDEEAAAAEGFDAKPAPITFSRTAFFPRYRPEGVDSVRPFDLGFDRRYSVHGEQVYEFERPLQVGDSLTAEVTLTDVYQRDGSRGGQMTFVEFEFTYTDQNDDLVLTERTTVIETGGAIDDGGDDS